jgi:hypothetical protein
MTTATQAPASTRLCGRSSSTTAAGSCDIAERFVTASYIDHYAPPGPPGGPDGANTLMRCLRGALSDLSYEVKDAFGFGDRVAVEPLTERAH